MIAEEVLWTYGKAEGGYATTLEKTASVNKKAVQNGPLFLAAVERN
jgi:hypothetical protein